MRLARAACVLAALCAGVPAAAHERTVSYSTWAIDGVRADVIVRLTALDVSRLPWAAQGGDIGPALSAYVSERLTLSAGGVRCPVTSGPMRLPSAADRYAYRWQVTCPSAENLEVRSALLLDVAPSHLHFARVGVAGEAGLERVLSEAEPAWTLGTGLPHSAVGDSLGDFLLLGIEHILTGYDHLVFLLGLLLLGGRLVDLVRIVTGFTVAHSITLALAVFGMARPEAAPIEALIGLSIALVAAENLWLADGRRPLVRWALCAVLLALAGLAARGWGSVPALTLAGLALFAVCYFGLLARVARPAPLRAAVAFVFGLIHGFGFAGVLLEAELASERLARALFGFNAGVELGQVAAVLALWPLLQLARRWGDGRIHRAVVDYGSAAILAIGVFWFVSRSYH